MGIKIRKEQAVDETNETQQPKISKYHIEGLQNKATLRDVNNLVGRRVLIRVDFNVPLKEDGTIADDNRIRQSLVTIKYCLERGAKVVLASHLGRPNGRDQKLSLDIVAMRLRHLLPKNIIYFAKDCIGKETYSQTLALQNGEVLLLENTRFYEDDERNTQEFAMALANNADLFVLDAFGTAHRAHASTVGITKFLPSVAGFLLEKELLTLSLITDKPIRPLTIIVGGKKVEDKMPIIKNLINKADNILIGGKMAQEFPLIQKDGVNIVVAKDSGFDISKETIDKFTRIISKSATIFWNGPMGVFERKQYSNGTKQIGIAVAQVAKKGIPAVIGGGDTGSALKQLLSKEELKHLHISTGGGASLEFIEDKELPGIAALPTVKKFNELEKKTKFI
ncbi:MAG: phosphoglycerate kinase [Christensenellaceae bacterium]|jgi:3-phosphoglycerate kinase|nr:phosphoglycerate kinase [Christensenellaceae bacterium]